MLQKCGGNGAGVLQKCNSWVKLPDVAEMRR
jgi:hypothetical protein